METSATHYTLGAPPVTGQGLGVSSDELDTVLAGPVASLVFDNAGMGEISTLLEGVADTDFARENLDPK